MWLLDPLMPLQRFPAGGGPWDEVLADGEPDTRASSRWWIQPSSLQDDERRQLEALPATSGRRRFFFFVNPNEHHTLFVSLNRVQQKCASHTVDFSRVCAAELSITYFFCYRVGRGPPIAVLC